MAQNPEIDVYKCSYLIYNKGAIVIQWRTDHFSVNGAGEIGTYLGGKKNLELDHI